LAHWRTTNPSIMRSGSMAWTIGVFLSHAAGEIVKCERCLTSGAE
jgi:hypothetical protein